MVGKNSTEKFKFLPSKEGPAVWGVCHTEQHISLQNRTWVPEPDLQQSQSTDTRLWRRKSQRTLQAPKQGEQATRVQKTQLSEGVQCLKAR